MPESTSSVSSSTESAHPSPAKRRRKVLGGGALAFVALYGVGGAIFDKRIESDLESRVPEALAEAGYPGVTAEFSGQTGTLKCTTPFADEQATKAATDVAYDVRGVHKIELDENCKTNTAPEESSSAAPAVTEPAVTTAPASSSATTQASTMADVLAADPQFSQFVVAANVAGLDLSDPALNPSTLFAPNNAAFDAIGADALAALSEDPARMKALLIHHMTDSRIASSELAAGELTMKDGSNVAVVAGPDSVTVGGAAIIDPDLEASNGVIHGVDKLIVPDGFDLSGDTAPAQVKVDGALDGGIITLTGTVASEDQRAALVKAAQGDGPPESVVDQLTIADDGANQAQVDQVSTLVTALRANLVDGRAGIDGESVYLAGHYRDDAARDAAQAAASGVNAEANLEPLPDATPAEADTLENELNAYVAAHPILFAPSSAALLPESETILDTLATQLKGVTGVSVAIEGHTDSDGSAAGNQKLSQERADAVMLGLAARGVDPATLTAKGFGSTQPVLGANGAEDKAASRRVVFQVTKS